MLKKTIVLLAVYLLVQMFYGCSASNKGSNETVEVKFWTDSDSEAVTDSLVKEILNLNWFTNYTKKQKPKIVVGKIINLSNENINSELIEKDIERSFISLGKVTFISSKAKREEIRSNRKSTSDFTNEKDFKKYLKPLKSDFFIEGKLELEIDSLIVPIKKKYKLSLKVTDTKNLSLVSTKNIVITK